MVQTNSKDFSGSKHIPLYTYRIVGAALSILEIVKEAFDNDTTPWYAITICIWSTIFLELWKRKNAVLAYEWDVDDFDDVEPDRPEYFGECPGQSSCLFNALFSYALLTRHVPQCISIAKLMK